MNAFVVVLIIAALAAVSGCSVQSVTSRSTTGAEATRACTVAPVTYGNLSGGTVEAGRVGSYQRTSGKLDGDRKRAGTAGPITWTTDATGTYVSWTVSGPHNGIAIVLKGGEAANVYRYDGGCGSGRRLSCPANSSGRPAQLSNITFYWNDCPGGC